MKNKHNGRLINYTDNMIIIKTTSETIKIVLEDKEDASGEDITKVMVDSIYKSRPEYME